MYKGKGSSIECKSHRYSAKHHACSPVSGWVKSLLLSFFGQLACTAPEEDHHHVIATALRPPAEWRKPVGRARATWLRTIVDDLHSLNFGVHTAWRKAIGRDIWHQVVSTDGNAPPWSSPVKKKNTKQYFCDRAISFRHFSLCLCCEIKMSLFEIFTTYCSNEMGVCGLIMNTFCKLRQLLTMSVGQYLTKL